MTARVRLSVEDGFAHLVLSSPPRNALDLAAFEELSELASGELPRLDARGLVVRGEGRHFSSGADVPGLLAALSGAADGGGAFVRRHAASLRAIEALPYPTVAAISGSCLGAALELALACRFRAAAPRAVMALPEAELGLMPGLGGVTRLAALVGRARAAELVLTGRTVGAEEALRTGLVDAVAARGGLVARAVALLDAGGRLGARGAVG